MHREVILFAAELKALWLEQADAPNAWDTVGHQARCGKRMIMLSCGDEAKVRCAGAEQPEIEAGGVDQQPFQNVGPRRAKRTNLSGEGRVNVRSERPRGVDLEQGVGIEQRNAEALLRVREQRDHRERIEEPGSE